MAAISPPVPTQAESSLARARTRPRSPRGGQSKPTRQRVNVRPAWANFLLRAVLGSLVGVVPQGHTRLGYATRTWDATWMWPDGGAAPLCGEHAGIDPPNRARPCTGPHPERTRAQTGMHSLP